MWRALACGSACFPSSVFREHRKRWCSFRYEEKHTVPHKGAHLRRCASPPHRRSSSPQVRRFRSLGISHIDQTRGSFTQAQSMSQLRSTAVKLKNVLHCLRKRVMPGRRFVISSTGRWIRLFPWPCKKERAKIRENGLGYATSVARCCAGVRCLTLLVDVC